MDADTGRVGGFGGMMPGQSSTGGRGPGGGPDPSGDASMRGMGRGVARRGSGVSIKDVASMANVSIATVSRVLNNPGLVAESTASRVHEAIRELGYRPNLFAKGLMTRRSRVIGVSMPDWSGDNYTELMRGADDRARELGYHLLVSSNAHRGGAVAGGFALDLIDGLVAMVTRSDSDEVELLATLDVPVVLLTTAADNVVIDTVELDNGLGAYEAVKHLLAGTPADRVYFVGGPQGNIDSDRRCAAFTRAMTEAGREPTEEQINRGTFSFRWGWVWAGKMHAAGKLAGAAVFAGNDEIAVAINHYARDVGLRVPEQLRLVGFDDMRYCPLLTPPMSSVRVPSRQLGAEAVTLMVRRIEEPESETRHVRLGTSLVIRESSLF